MPYPTTIVLVAASTDESKRQRRDRTRTVAITLLTIALAVFAVLNVNSVKVDWIVGSSHAPLIVVIAVSVLIGAALTWLGERVAARRRGRGPHL
jgi:uncharacterized integral membrane protein